MSYVEDPRPAKKMSRRTFLKYSAVVGGASLLHGCVVQTAPPQASAPQAPSGATPAPVEEFATIIPGSVDIESSGQISRGGVLRHVERLAIDSLDPHLANVRETVWMPMLYDTLLTHQLVDPATETFEIRPGLAESYEVVDPTIIVFKLREGVKFHDGTDFNAEVAKWNLERAASHPDSTVKETVQTIGSIEVIDNNTLQLNLTAPSPALPLQFTPANPVTVFFVSQQAVESMGEEEFARSPVGSGPMQFQEWILDDRLTLQKFSDHWEMGEDGQPLPYVDGYEGRLITDQTVALVEMRTGNMDIFPDILLQDVESAQADPNLTVVQLPGRWRGYPSLYFNPNPPAGSDYPFSQHKALREAAQYATDKESMAAALGFGLAAPHYYWAWYPGVPGYDGSLPKREFDLEKARALVQEAGFPSGVDVEVKVINRTIDTQPLEILQAMWAEAGIRLNINLMDRLPWIDDGRAGNFEALSHSNTSQVSPLLRQETRTGSTYNWAGYSNPEMDQLWEQVLTEYDEAKRAEIYRQMQQILYDDAYHFIGFRQSQIVALSNPVRNLSALHNFRYIWLDTSA